jgi:hypothetical protein
VVLAGIKRDLAVSGLSGPKLHLIPARDWPTAVPDPTFDPAQYGFDELVCVTDRGSFLVDSRSAASLTVDIASRMADQVMDELNSPWPTMVTGEVLEPELDADGVAVWASEDARLCCPIGYLSTTFAAAGLLLATPGAGSRGSDRIFP